MTDERLDSFIDRLVRAGVITSANGGHLHTTRTIYGTLIFMFDPERMRELLGGIFMDFLWQLQQGQPLDLEAIKASAGIGPDEEIEVTVDVTRELRDEYEQCTKHAMELLSKHLRETLEQTIEQQIEVTVIRALLDRSGKGFFKFDVKEKEVIDVLVKSHVKALKEKLGARQRGGSEGWWTPERKDEFLRLYDSALKMMGAAKKIYRQNKTNPKWPMMIRAVYSKLPESFINKLAESGKDAEPNVLALEYAAIQFGVEPNEYLVKILIEARRARQKTTDAES